MLSPPEDFVKMVKKDRPPVINNMAIKEARTMETEKKKKGFFATIWESMTKTGGCCGPGETCGGPAKEDDKKGVASEAAEESDG